MILTFEAEFAEWLVRRKAEQQERRAYRALFMRRVRVRDPLPMARIWLHGPRWRRLLVNADGLIECEPAGGRRPPRLLYDFTDDVRELVLEPIRFDVYAEWSDPRERLQG